MEQKMTREVGHARAVRNVALAEDNPALAFPRSSRTFAKMLREDAKVKSVYRAVTLPIRRANWQLEPNGATPGVVAHVAEDLRLQVRGEDTSRPVARRAGRVSWEQHLEQLLHALAFGAMFFEQVYEPGVDGREHLVKLAPRWPGTVDKVNVAADGGLESIVQRGMTRGDLRLDRVEIPVGRLVAYVFDDVGSQWTGTSIFRPAYKHWKLKDKLLRDEVVTLERNGQGVPVYTGSELAADPEDDLKHGQEVAEDIRGGSNSGASIPAGSKLALMGVSGQLVSPREAITYHDNQIAIAVLANFLNLEGKGGSYALAQTQSDFFNQSEQTVADWVQDVANHHVVEDLVSVAFPEYDGPAPRIVFDAIGSRKELTEQGLSSLINSKLILPDKDLEEHFRRVYSMPAKQDLSDALKSKLDRQKLEEQMGVSLSEPEESAEQIINNWIESKVEGVVRRE